MRSAFPTAWWFSSTRPSEAQGGPQNLLCAVADPTIESAGALMKHPGVSILVVTGGPGVVKAAMASGKKAICAGPGNPPCVVDETADIVKAGRDIVAGSSFDNNVVCICEKEVLAVESIADRLKQEMRANGAFELTGPQIEAVTRLVIPSPKGPRAESAPNKDMVGQGRRRSSPARRASRFPPRRGSSSWRWTASTRWSGPSSSCRCSRWCA